MLKALELIGFKSFADKTRFEFGEGITVVVGPNGSGKSNVVDAIKWVLGETSAKSLRGKEMTDCIFNGSASRSALNSAEITLTFDNTDGKLPVETPEVHITRRVYRSGEGEYLINRQGCRKRDIRDLLAGTGMGTGSYCIIEQGKVDSLLQSSPRDRRLIFEEAAGISRFRVKKVETERRLERVDQNLLRLKDIVDEVENRLKAIRSQASRAQRYREHTARLQELRTQIGLADWRRLSGQLAGFDAEIRALADEIAAQSAEAERLEQQHNALEDRLSQAESAAQRCETLATGTAAAVAGHESTIEHETQRRRDLETEVARERRQLAVMNLRAGDLSHQWRETSTAVKQAENEHRQLVERLAGEEQALQELSARLDELREANEQRRGQYMEQMRATAALGNEISAAESQLAGDEQSIERCRHRIAEVEDSETELEQELAQLHEEQRKMADVEGRRREEIAALQAELSDQRSRHAALLEQAGQLRQRQSGARERSTLLEELEHRQDGLATGAKDVLRLAGENKRGPWRNVLGLVADLFHVNMQTAPLLEVALGEQVGYVVLRNERGMVEQLSRSSSDLPGRVGVILLDENAPPPELPELDELPGVLGRADRFVETSPPFRSLALLLLGRTWFVEDLPAALALARHAREQFPHDPLTFVTLAGEVIADDHTLLLGPRQVATGLISRRSELRSLSEEIDHIAREIEQAEQAAAGQLEETARIEERLLELVAEHRKSSEALGECRQRVQAAQGRLANLQRSRAVADAELGAAEKRRDTTLESLESTRQRQKTGETELGEIERVIAAAAREIIGADQRRADAAAGVTSGKVELAKSEERLENLRRRLQQFEKDREERNRAVNEYRSQLAHSERRLSETCRNILSRESQLAELYLQKENLSGETAHLARAREEVRKERAGIARAEQKIRTSLRKQQEQHHAKDLAAGEIRLQRNTLAERLREDYGIELAELEHEPTEEELAQREQTEQEIAELRRKIGNIGNVNLEALGELEELESRFANLSAQHEDLSTAKRELEGIINKINTDSRRMFAETLEIVREHFVGLFRKLFGGGQADLVLDESADLLEAGVEINARPPGKELRNISLLSGGEKTLTCVALLLAIFRSRPAPFCVLDEVDAALDEANIGRYVNVLNDFLSWTQFIVITHSKKTMTCANTLYGVTMQESGVSKRVSVKFEDVSEDGEINVADEGDEQAA